jgi:hypothetical protein
MNIKTLQIRFDFNQHFLLLFVLSFFSDTNDNKRINLRCIHSCEVSQCVEIQLFIRDFYKFGKSLLQFGLKSLLNSYVSLIFCCF